MDSLTDQELLRDYAGKLSDTAFAELVRRHVDFVFSAAQRMVCDAHLAEDVTQGVFVALSQNARQLTNHPVLSGWLHRTTQNIAAQTVRTDVRRRVREQEAATMNELLAPQSDTAAWEHIAPQLDAALGELNEPDRDAVLLRYFEKKSAHEMSQTLGISNEAAQKRVTRAVDRLRELLIKRGVTVGAGGLVAIVSTNAVQSAPAGLATSISSTAGITLGAAGIAKTIVMTTLQKIIVGAAVTAAVGVAIIQTHQASQLRDRVQALEQQQEPLNAELKQKKIDQEAAALELASLRDENQRLSKNTGELMRLRNEVGTLRNTTAQLEHSAGAAISAPAPAATKGPDTAAVDAGRELGKAIARGEPGTLEKLTEMGRAASKSLASIPAGLSELERSKFAVSAFAPIREAFSVIDEAVRNGNTAAIPAVEKAIQIPELAGNSVQVMSTLAGNGNQTALEMLLNPDKYGITTINSVVGLRGAASAGNQEAIDALSATTRDEKQTALWFLAAEGLTKSAEAGNATAIDALIGISSSTNINVRNSVVRGLRAAAGNQNEKAAEALCAMGLK